MLKCASRRRTICGVISGCEGIVNARGTKRNCFWGYGSAEKYGFTARRMRISLTNVSEVAEREDRLYSFFVALVNHGALEYYGQALKHFESRRQENRGDSKIVIRISIIIKIVSSNIVARSENRNRSACTLDLQKEEKKK